jgi:hypothetical protein
LPCPRCGQSAGYHGDRQRTPLSPLGPIPLARAYYYCRRCGQGFCPFDDDAGLTDRNLTPALQRLATLAGAVADSFGKGAELLEERAGARLSESTVGRTAVDAGRCHQRRCAAGEALGRPAPWGWHPDARGRLTAYVSLDATGVRQQGPGGAAAEGRMAYVGMVFNPAPDPLLCPPPPGRPRPPMQARYVSGLYPLAAMGPLLRRQAAQVGMESAEVWVALTDGGSGLEELLRTNFGRPDLVVILDFWHAASYLEELARQVYPADDETSAKLAEQWCRLLKEEGGAVTLAVLAEWDFGPRKSKGLREQLARVAEYFGNNLHRMGYPEYVAEGWQIGSGAVESACKTVVGQRLKGAGMRWGEEGAHALCHIRALYRSEKGQWEAFWQRRPAA